MKIALQIVSVATITVATSSLRAQPASTASSVADNAAALLQAGRAVYDQHCSACHGADGKGDGPAAVWVFPKPRNFSDGLFKLQSTPAGSPPSDEDLLNTVVRGMPGSSMPSFTYLSEQQQRDVVQYVKYLTAFADASGQRINRFEEAAQKGEIKPSIHVPPEPPLTLEALVKGKELFSKLQCNSCHGETGAGDGPSAATLKDKWGLPLPPRDFNIGAFRGGSTGHDLYLRLATGLAGTPMPPFGDDMLNPDDRWALVHYVQSLRRKDAEVHDILAPEDTGIRALRVSNLPTTPTDPAWEQFDSVRVPLNPLWPEQYPVLAVAVTALHDGKRIAILCQWKDAIVNGAPIRVQDFQDGMALQFSLSGKPAFLGMGDAQNPVNLWYWRAGWQQEVDGARPDMDTRYASMHVDTYFQPERQFSTAADAGNILAQSQKSPVEDTNARGFGTLKSQPLNDQNVQGKGIWRDGFWNVLFARDLKSTSEDDVKFDAKNPVPVAFAVWNGEQRDRNGRKVVSNWYTLVLDGGEASTSQR
jgi:mono/diheme cytochrome c family protein